MSDSLDTIVELPIEEQAKHADFIIKKEVNSGQSKMIEKAFDDDDQSMNRFDLWTITSVGNIAYIIVYYNNQTIQEKAKKIFGCYLEWYNDSNISNHRRSCLFL
jgi:hypothetical protein